LRIFCRSAELGVDLVVGLNVLLGDSADGDPFGGICC
jgi:hypothetical protein